MYSYLATFIVSFSVFAVETRADTLSEKMCVSGSSGLLNGEYTLVRSETGTVHWEQTLGSYCYAYNNADKLYIRATSFSTSTTFEISYQNAAGCYYARCSSSDPIQTIDSCSNWNNANSWSISVQSGACPVVECSDNVMFNAESTSSWDENWGGKFNKVADNVYVKADYQNEYETTFYWLYSNKYQKWYKKTGKIDVIPSTNSCSSRDVPTGNAMSYDFPVNVYSFYRDYGSFQSSTSIDLVGCDEDEANIQSSQIERRRLLDYA